MKTTTEADVEMRRLEVMNDELDRLHKMVFIGKTKRAWEWALARIEELQAVIVASQFVVTDGPAYDDGHDNEGMI